jgi:hypothetical protein
MSLIDKHRSENPDSTHKAWLNMHIKSAMALEKVGSELIAWENMSVLNCIYMETLYSELEMYEAAAILRDNIHKCFDYNSSPLSGKGGPQVD